MLIGSYVRIFLLNTSRMMTQDTQILEMNSVKSPVKTRKLQHGQNGIKSKLGTNCSKGPDSPGLKSLIHQSSDYEEQSLQENVYRGFLQSMAGAKPADRRRYMDGWAEAIKAGNEERSPKAVNRKLVELGLIDEDILNDKKGNWTSVQGGTGRVDKTIRTRYN